MVNLLQVLSRLDRFRWFDVVLAAGAISFLGLAAWWSWLTREGGERPPEGDSVEDT